MKKIAIVQSNYIPWKGYFDLIAAVDEFVLYDDVQFTKNDWRNRNKIKTPGGVQWLSVPVGTHLGRRVRDVQLRDARWQAKHWKSLEANYRRAPHFQEVAGLVGPLYVEHSHSTLSEMNRTFIEAICGYLGIGTRISNSWDYRLLAGKTARLVDLCRQAGADAYVSGPAARDYLDEGAFRQCGIGVEWFDYTGYPAYPQLWGGFTHELSILDLLFNCGRESSQHMKFIRP